MDRDEANILFRRLREALYSGRGASESSERNAEIRESPHMQATEDTPRTPAKDMPREWQELKMAVHRDAMSDNDV